MTDETIGLILWALEEYPLSEPRDIVKLLYQREFGPAHAVSDPERAREMLLTEYRSCGQEEGLPFVWLGNGYLRLDLHMLDHNGISPSRAAELFISSAAPVGDKSAFISLLRELAKDDLIVPLMPSLPAYIEDYIASGCPAVSHSEVYRTVYRPAYRVIRGELLLEE